MTGIRAESTIRRLTQIGLFFAATAALYTAALGIWYFQNLVPTQAIPPSSAEPRSNYQVPHRLLATRANKTLTKFFATNPSPSISAAIGLNGQVVWAGAIGYADIDQQILATPQHRYRAGSVSKSLTSIAMARLIDQGKFDLDKPISHYLSAPKFHPAITSRMLANHSAGIRHYNYDLSLWPPMEFFYNQHFETVTDALSVFAGDDLLFEPGSDFSYSSYGYNLLSVVLEKAAKQPFVKLVAEEVFVPAGMSNTSQDKPAKQRVNFYLIDGENYSLAPEVDLSVKISGGGFLSTPSDLVKAGNLILTTKHVKAETLKQLFTPLAKTENGKDPDGYALGWVLAEFKNDHLEHADLTQMSHSGGSVGGLSYLMLIPELNIVVAAQTNSFAVDGGAPSMGDLSKQLTALVLDNLDP